MKTKAILTKGLLGIAAILSGSGTASAEITDKWMGTVEFNPVFNTQSGVDPSFNINFVATRRVNEYFSAGVGIGLEESFKFKGTPSLPVFARFHAEDFSKMFSPYANFDLGYQAVFGDGKGGLLIAPTVGVRYDCFSVGIGYRGFKSTASGSKMSSAIAINLGYTFGLHKPDSEFLRALKKTEFSIAATALLGNSNAGEYSWSRFEAIYNGGTRWGGHFAYTNKPTYGTSGMFSIALTYPVWKNLYVGVAGGIMVTARKGNYDVEITQIHEDDVERGEQYCREWKALANDRDTDTEWGGFVAFRAKYKVKELTFGKRFYPYAQVDLGSFVGVDDYGKGDASKFYFAPEVGVSMQVGNRHSLDIGVGYKPIWGESIFNDSDRVWDSESYSSSKFKKFGKLAISVGYTF